MGKPALGSHFLRSEEASLPAWFSRSLRLWKRSCGLFRSELLEGVLCVESFE